MKLPPLPRLISAAVIGITAIVFGVGLWAYFSPDGTYEVSMSAVDTDHPILELEPRGRLGPPEKNLATGDAYRRIREDLVYINAKLPRLYQSVELELQYRNTGQPILEVGLVQKDAWKFDLQPFEIGVVDKARKENWPSVKTDTYELLRRDSAFPSDFGLLAQLNPRLRTYRYGVITDIPFIDPTYQPSPRRTVLTTPLRGSHVLYAYVKNEPLTLSAEWTDLNRQNGVDSLTIQAFAEDDSSLVGEAATGDDGIILPTGQATPQHTSLRIEGLKEGLYKIILATSDDALFTRLETDQDRFAFRNHIFLAGNVEYTTAVPGLNLSPTELRTTASQVTFTTPHENGLQDIRASDGTVLTLHGTNERPTWVSQIADRNASFFFPRNDATAEGPGWYFLPGMERFSPDEAKRILDPLKTPLGDVDLVISPSSYVSPLTLRSGRRIATKRFDITAAHADASDSELTFLLHAPGLGQVPGELLLERVTVRAYKQPFSLSRFLSR